MLLSSPCVRIAHAVLNKRCLYHRGRDLNTAVRTARAVVRVVPEPLPSTFTSRPERHPTLRRAFFSSASLHHQTSPRMTDTSPDLRQRRPMATNTTPSDKPDHSHEPSHDHSHSHSHSHGIFGHSHDHDETSENAQQVVNAFQNSGVLT